MSLHPDPDREPTVGPGMRTTHRAKLTIGKLADVGGYKGYGRLEVEITRREPQAAVTTTHDDTPATAGGWSIVWCGWMPSGRDIVWSSPGDPTEVDQHGYASLSADEVARIRWADGWDLDRFTEVAALAGRWHLNDMQGACAHQEIVWETDPRFGTRRPSLDQTPVCPQSGYRYGSAWLHEIVPAEVEEALMALGGWTR